MNNKGMFICFEGLDGSGKSTIAKEVVKLLKKENDKVIFLDKKSTDFDSGYVTSHMKAIKDILWDYAPDDPLNELGDHHWLYLNASWFSVLDKCKLQPLIEKGYTVVMDNWYFKFLARFSLKENFNFQLAQDCFSQLTAPDLTIFLDVDPEVAVSRREEFSISETGNMDGLSGRTSINFITYQSSVREKLKVRSIQENWLNIDVNIMSEEDVTEEIFNHLINKKDFVKM